MEIVYNEVWVCERESYQWRLCLERLVVVIFIYLLKALSLKAVVQNHHLTLTLVHYLACASASPDKVKIGKWFSIVFMELE